VAGITTVVHHQGGKSQRVSSVAFVDLLLSCSILMHLFQTCSCSIWLCPYLSLLFTFQWSPARLGFQTMPSRKLYPDYYQIIKNPIALDDIKKRLDTGAYSSLQTTCTDFELLFNNTLEYNMKDSVCRRNLVAPWFDLE